MGINNKKNGAIIQDIGCIIALLFILTVLIVHLVLPDKTFSKEERRYLAQWPVFRAKEVLNGSYEAKVESYFLDQFPFRDFWIDMQEGSNRILLKKGRDPVSIPR